MSVSGFVEDASFRSISGPDDQRTSPSGQNLPGCTVDFKSPVIDELFRTIRCKLAPIAKCF